MDARVLLVETNPTQTLREIEEFIEAALVGSEYKTPELKLCHPPRNSITPISESDASANNNGSTATISSLDINRPRNYHRDEAQGSGIRKITGLRRLLVTLALVATNFLYGLNATMIGNLQIFITEEFDEIRKLGWIGVSFALGSAFAVLPFSKALNMFNDKWICLSCVVLYAAAMGLCGGAPSINAVIIGHTWAGIAGTGMFMTTSRLFSAISLSSQNPWHNFTATSIFGAGCILGPVISGVLCESSASWRWAFYFQAIGMGTSVPIYMFLLPPKEKEMEAPFLSKIRQFDWLGTLLLAGLLTSFAIAFTSGGALHPWKSGRVIGAIVTFVALTMAFVLSQYFTAPSYRLFPASSLRRAQLLLLFMTTASASAALLISIYYIPVHFLYVYGDDANVGALRVIPFVSFWWWLLVVCDILLPRVGYHGLWYMFSGLCLTAGGATMYTVRSATTPPTIAGFMVLYILGLLTSEAQHTVGLAMAAIGKRRPRRNVNFENEESTSLEPGDIASFLSFAQALGGFVGLVVASVVFQSGAHSALNGVLGDAGLTSKQLTTAITGRRSDAWNSVSDPRLRIMWLDALVRSVDNVWMLVVVAGGVYSVCAYGMSRKRFIEVS